MSYRRYECPKQPETPLDAAATVVGVIVVALATAFVVMMAWCTL